MNNEWAYGLVTKNLKQNVPPTTKLRLDATFIEFKNTTFVWNKIWNTENYFLLDAAYLIRLLKLNQNDYVCQTEKRTIYYIIKSLILVPPDR